MIAVIFEVKPAAGKRDDYLKIAASLRTSLDKVDGFISVERFQSLTDPDKMLSLSFFENEEAVKEWRSLSNHRSAQKNGRDGIFSDYRLRVAHVLRDYSMFERDEAPSDSKAVNNVKAV